MCSIRERRSGAGRPYGTMAMHISDEHTMVVVATLIRAYVFIVSILYGVI
jgi:hypothetical protein